jgi:alkylation response protein AidB-like acyl-CoA dehydrogenase
MDKPLIATFWFRREEVLIHQDWNSMGMTATASYSFEVKQLKLPEKRKFAIDRKHCFLNHPDYRFPFQQLAEATLAVNLSGMAIHFLELCEELFHNKAGSESTEINNAVHIRLVRAKKRLNEARMLFYSSVETSWQELLLQDCIDAKLLTEVSSVSMDLATIAREITDDLFPWCGMIAVNRNSDMNRVWRDIHTASQHSLLRPVEE